MNDGGKDYATYTNAELGLRDEYEAQLAVAQAVIGAARAVLKHVETTIVVHRKTKKTWLEVGIYNGWITQEFPEGSDDFPDTLLGRLAGLRAAVDALDETTEGGEGE